MGGMPHGKSANQRGEWWAQAVAPRQGSRYKNQGLMACMSHPLIGRDECSMQGMPFSRMAAGDDSGGVEIQGGVRAAAGGAHPRSCSCCSRCCQWSRAGPSCCLHVRRPRKRAGFPLALGHAARCGGGGAEHALAAGNTTQTVAPQGQG